MQTFMPHGDYQLSAMALDNKRLNKQRVEAWQVLQALQGKYDATGAWTRHPAVIMWRGFEQSLIEYGMEMCREWLSRGGNDVANLYDRFAQQSTGWSEKPWWVNFPLLNASHQSNLVRKDPEYYKFDVPNDLPYIWPNNDGSFKVGERPKVTQNV